MEQVTEKKGIKVLMVYPNPTHDNLIPAGMSILSACLKRAGHNVKAFDTTFYESDRMDGEKLRERTLQVIPTNLEELGIKIIKGDYVGDFRKMVEEYQPDLIGLSVTELSYRQGIELLNGIKDIKIPKIMGGVHATFSPEEVIAEDGVDIICLGEGENALVELANRIRDGKDYSDVLNLWVKKDGEVIKNPVGPLINLDSLPVQDWEIWDEKRRYKPFVGGVVSTASIETSRGCWKNCAYCCNPMSQQMYADAGHGSFHRAKSPEKVIEEVRFLKDNYRIEFIKFCDPDFMTRGREDFKKLVELYQDLKIRFWAETTVEKVTPDRIEGLEKMNCAGIALGIESGNEFIRNEVMNKKTAKDSIVRAFGLLKNTKMRVVANIIIGSPFETRESIFDSIKLMIELGINRPIINVFSPYRGTKLHQTCVDEGYMHPEALAGDYRGECVLNMPQLPAKEIEGLQRTFLLYVRFSKEKWPEIQRAEQDDEMFEKLAEEYAVKYPKR